jgi:hypothetical protein
MWYRIEGNAEPCPCGDVAEKWILLAGAKPLSPILGPSTGKRRRY